MKRQWLRILMVLLNEKKILELYILYDVSKKINILIGYYKT